MSHNPDSVMDAVSRLKTGEKGAPADKLWQRYFHRLVSLARFKLKGRPCRVADEEDVASEAFNSFCQAAFRGRYPDLIDRDNLWSLLVTITARKVFQLNAYHGRLKRGKNEVLDEAALDRLTSDESNFGISQIICQEPTPEFAAQAVEQYELLLQKLGEENLKDLAKWKMEGFTNEEIAAKLNRSPKTVERRLKLIRKAWSENAEDTSPLVSVQEI